ncbi:MAG TPA: methylated-DNA--[protein]-cysteine S-methyltransferase [Chloroflexota bacterium]|nr:methylated-DNA--[protein]-cysteine S-methyltransferase [Chloroflexota bacterium]
MAADGFTLFETAIGWCGLAWGARGIVGVQLPEASELETRARLRRRFPEAREGPPPPEVQRALEGIVALLRGEARDLSTVPLDMEHVPPFHRRVYEVTRTIPPGSTLSYGEIAARLGEPGSARAVGYALGRNPFAIVVPCHRVLAAGGKVGGFSAGGGTDTKRRLLSIEGAPVPAVQGALTLFEGDGTFPFDPRVAVEHLRASDAALARVIDAAGPFRMELETTPSIFAALAQAIVYQQLTGKAAATIFARVRALFPPTPGGPTPEQILHASDEALRGAGLSGAKVLALRDLARRTVDGEIPSLAEVHRMEDEAIVERLTRVRGIGRWTVEMLLMFRLGRPDVLPLDDYALRKGAAILLQQDELPSRKELEAHGARWRPYRTVASWYLWRAVELARK